MLSIDYLAIEKRRVKAGARARPAGQQARGACRARAAVRDHARRAGACCRGGKRDDGRPRTGGAATAGRPLRRLIGAPTSFPDRAPVARVAPRHTGASSRFWGKGNLEQHHAPRRARERRRAHARTRSGHRRRRAGRALQSLVGLIDRRAGRQRQLFGGDVGRRSLDGVRVERLQSRRCRHERPLRHLRPRCRRGHDYARLAHGGRC